MAEYTVTAPDGKEIVLEGPAGASDAEILAQAKRLYAEQAQAPKVSNIPEYQSAIVGAGKGILNPLMAGGQYVGGAPAQFVENVQQRMKPFEEANPKSFTGGELGGSLLTGGAMLKGAGAVLPSFAKANQYLQGATVGGATNILTPNTEGKTGLEAIAQIPEKGAVGAVGGAGGTLLGKSLANVVAPKLVSGAQKLIGEGVNLTPGQMLGGALRSIEEKATSIPLLGDVINYSRQKGVEEFNKAAYRRVLAPISGEIPEQTGRAGVEAVKSKIDDAYGKLLPKIKFQRDPTFETQLGKIPNTVEGITEENATKVLNDVNKIINSRIDKNGQVKGESFKIIEEKLGDLAKTFKSSGDADQRLMGKAYEQSLIELRKNLLRSNPEYAEELSKINTAYANFVRLRGAGSAANTQESFTPSQLAAAVKNAEKSAGKGQTATGQALMQDLSDAGVTVMPSKTPDSGTAGRMAINSLVGSGLGAGTVTGVPLTTETAAALGIASLPYMPGGRQLATMLIGKRPEAAQKLAEAIRKSSPFLASPGAVEAQKYIKE